MTAVLAFLGRAFLGGVLVLAVLTSALLTAFGPQGAWKLAWLPLMAVVIWGSIEAWERLGKRLQRGAQR